MAYKNQTLIPHSAGGWKSEIRVLKQEGSEEAEFAESALSRCPHMANPTPKALPS